MAVLNHWPADDVLAVCALRQITDGFREECRDGISVEAIDMRGLWDVPALSRLIRYCRDFKPDLIHTQLSRADWVGRPLARLIGVPVVSTIHNVHSRMYAGEFSSMTAWGGGVLDRVTMPLASRLVAVSDGVRRDLEAQGIPPDRIVVIHNALDGTRRRAPIAVDDVRRAWGCGPDDIVVGTVALLKQQKGLSFLIHAAGAVVAANPHVRFVHMGDGPLGAVIDRQIRSAGLESRVRLLGRVADPMALLPALDVFVLPSLWEGLPVALLEAMAAGLPSVGTRVSGIEDVIEDGRTGLLVPPSNAEALAAAILQLAADPAARQRLGLAARARLRDFDPAVIAAAYRRVHAEVLPLAPPTGEAADPRDTRAASQIK